MTDEAGLGIEELEVLGAVPLGPDDPERVGRYRLLGLLGAGGMGRVYLAEGGRKYVAIKVVRTELADDPRFRRRFARELEVVNRLDAAFTAALVDGQADVPRPWMATEYVPGVSLDDAVEPPGGSEVQPLPTEAVWRLAAGIGSALTAIHQAGLVHRDLKPSNVILTLDGPKVIDFGVAGAADLSQLTVTGQQIGTPAFMAPEQAKSGTTGPAADVFAAGGLLVYAATGRAPFGGGSATEVLFRVVYEEPDLGGLETLDERLYALALRCLAKDPGERPDAAALVAAVVEARLAPRWPDEVRERIERRAQVAGALGRAGSGALTTIAGLGDGLPRRETPREAAVRRHRRPLAIAVAVCTVAAVAAVIAVVGPGRGSTRGAASGATGTGVALNASAASGPVPSARTTAAVARQSTAATASANVGVGVGAGSGGVGVGAVSGGTVTSVSAGSGSTAAAGGSSNGSGSGGSGKAGSSPTPTTWSATEGPGCGMVLKSGYSWYAVAGTAMDGCGNGSYRTQKGDGAAADWVFTPGAGKYCEFTMYIPDSSDITSLTAFYQVFDKTTNHDNQLGSQYMDQKDRRGGSFTLGEVEMSPTGTYDLQLYDNNAHPTNEYAGVVVAQCGPNQYS